MKFTCEKKDLVSAISITGRTVAAKSPIPALEGILVQAGVKVTLTGFNLETGITVSMDADVTEEGSAVFPAKLFFDIVRKMPDDTIIVSVDDNLKVSLRGGISSFTISAQDAEDYPDLPDVDSEKGIEIPQKELKTLITGTIFAVSDNQARPIHTGCKFEIEDSSITVIAVDGYRMAMRRWKAEIGRTVSFVVPAAALREIEKIVGDSEEICRIYPGSKHIQFEVGNAILVSRILTGDFLDWKRVLPENNPIKLCANVTSFMDSVDRVSLMVTENLKSPVRCLFEEDCVEMRTFSAIGEAKDSCSIAGDGQGLEIGFNSRYLMDALKAVTDGECMLELSNGLSPIVLSPCSGEDSYRYMVLPVRLKQGE